MSNKDKDINIKKPHILFFWWYYQYKKNWS